MNHCNSIGQSNSYSYSYICMCVMTMMSYINFGHDINYVHTKIDINIFITSDHKNDTRITQIPLKIIFL
jgi:hypothetical protein